METRFQFVVCRSTCSTIFFFIFQCKAMCEHPFPKYGSFGCFCHYWHILTHTDPKEKHSLTPRKKKTQIHTQLNLRQASTHHGTHYYFLPLLLKLYVMIEFYINSNDEHIPLALFLIQNENGVFLSCVNFRPKRNGDSIETEHLRLLRSSLKLTDSMRFLLLFCWCSHLLSCSLSAVAVVSMSYTRTNTHRETGRHMRCVWHTIHRCAVAYNWLKRDT